MRRTALGLMLVLWGACLPDAKPDGGVIDSGVGVVDGGVVDAGVVDAGVVDGGAPTDGGRDAGAEFEDAGLCDPVPAAACVQSGRYGSRLDGGVFDYRGPCAANELASTLGGGCCERMAMSCTFVGGFVCTMPGNEAGGPPCCFDLCDGGEPCDCRRAGSCSCTGGSCGSRVPTYRCPIIGNAAP